MSGAHPTDSMEPEGVPSQREALRRRESGDSRAFETAESARAHEAWDSDQLDNDAGRTRSYIHIETVLVFHHVVDFVQE